MLVGYRDIYGDVDDICAAYQWLRDHKDDIIWNIRHCMDCLHPVSWISIMRSHDAIMWLYWVNENICLNIDKDLYKTTEVRLRIATGMLNNISDLSDELKIQLHSCLTHNVRKEYLKIQESLLPF